MELEWRVPGFAWVERRSPTRDVALGQWPEPAFVLRRFRGWELGLGRAAFLPEPSLTSRSCVTLGKLLTAPSLGFPICRGE